MLYHYVLAALLVVQGCLAHIGYRIVNGDDAKPHEFPFIVSFKWKNPTTNSYEHRCAGSILSAEWIVTAAHCIKNVPIEEYEVYSGKHYINQRENGQQVSSIAHIYIHENYDENTGESDIGLVRLKTPFVIDTVVHTALVTLPDPASKDPTDPVVVAGWGSMSNNESPNYATVLQKATVPIVENKKCSYVLHELPGDIKLFPSQWCTGPLRGSASACVGDGGGPLIQDDSTLGRTLIGIVSWGVSPCGSGDPTIYTRVSLYVDWLTDKMNK